MFTKKIFSVLTIIGMLVVLAIVTGAQSDESEAGAASRLKAQDKKAKQLSGTWAMTITITSGPPQLPPPSPGFNTYTADGDVLVTFVPAPGTIAATGQGVWIRTGDRQFALTFSNLRFDEKGNFLGTFKAREKFTLNEALNESTGQVKWEVADPTGQVVRSGEATTRGRRIGVEPVE